MRSTDDGRTWSEPRPLDLMTQGDDMALLTGGPCHGIQLARGPRSVAISRDGGETFPSTKRDPELAGPGCQTTLCRYSWPEDAKRGGKSRILFCNPATRGGGEDARRGMTVNRGEGTTMK